MRTWQRCFSIPKSKLDIFLCYLTKQNGIEQYIAHQVFDAGNYYDVFVIGQGMSDPFMQNRIVDFFEGLK